ncbi:MAG: MFS transporter, partial [Treponema sp.]|nr:MFS transporter [Treponema sp.]
IGLCIATLWPSIQSYAGSQLAVDPTILMIFLSCFGLPGFNSATFIMGVIGDRWGLRASFIVAPVYILFALILMLIDRKLGKKTVR